MKQVNKTSPLEEFTKQEAYFRLTDTFGLKHPSDKLVNELTEHLYETTESWIDSEKIEELTQDFLVEKGYCKKIYRQNGPDASGIGNV